MDTEDVLTVECAGCKTTVEIFELDLIDGCGYCEKCYSQLFSYCDCCGYPFKNDKLHEVMGKFTRLYVCEDCLPLKHE